MRTIIALFFSILLQGAFAQDQENIDKYITAMVAKDTILEGSTFEFKIVIRNLKGDFTPPSFSDFDIVGGPNMSTSMQYINGNMFRESTYTYYLRARKVGEHYIEESYLEIEGENMETAAIPVYVVDNPEDIRKEYRIKDGRDAEFVFPFSDPLQDTDDKKLKKGKRKLKKI